MGKLEDMMRGAGANVGESMGAGRQAGVVNRATGPTFSGIPARLQGVIKSKDVAEIPVDRIIPDPDQPREEFDEAALDFLAESLKARGQLQPIRVRWNEEQGTYVVLCGERRWRAATRAGIKTMTCVIQEGAIPPGELLALQLVENLIREDLKPIEQAKAYRSLIDLNGWSARQVARELAIDHTSVTRALALLELPEPVQARVEQGEIAPSTATELGKLGDAATIEAVAAEVVQNKMSRAEASAAVKEAREARTKGKGRGAKPGPPKPRTFRMASGKVVVEPKKIGGLEAMASMLQEALDTIRAELVASDQEAA